MDKSIQIYPREAEGFEVSEKIGQLKLSAEDGKSRFTDCENSMRESLNS
jgi:hypothetical protein